MTIVDRIEPAAVSAAPEFSSRLSPVRLRFLGNREDYWWLMIRGGLLQMITLGIYRFWLFTDMRRFLWASTAVDDETLEYTGTGLELLIGFLLAIGILVPIYALLFVASLEFGILSRLSGVVAVAVLAGFGQYALYRARRYRLTRTVFRGLRFHQTGSAVRYAVRAMLWWIPTVLTLGLASPWATANLERYKMRNTFYGSLGGSFAGSGGRLFLRGLLIWLLIVGPFVAGIVAAIVTIDWPAVGRAFDLASYERAINALRGNESLSRGIRMLAGGILSSSFFAMILYPAYEAIAMRWWLGGLRLGGAAVASDLPMRRYYFAYLRYLLYVVTFSIAYFAVAVALIAIAYFALRGSIDFAGPPFTPGANGPGAIFAAISGILLYAIYILGISTIYQVVVKMRLWQVAIESILISSITALDHVQADAATSSAVGEGLADALGAGAI